MAYQVATLRLLRKFAKEKLEHLQLENALATVKAGSSYHVQTQFIRALSADVGVSLHLDFVKSQSVITIALGVFYSFIC